jgi:hypothetical protein
MGVFRKYRDANGKPTGPWFIQYPVGRDPKSGKMRYTTKKASWQKKKAREIFRKKHDEFYQKERLGVTVDPELTFKELISWGLDQEVMRVKASAADDVTRAGHLISHFGNLKAVQITPLMVDNFRVKMKRTISKSTGRAYSGTTINKMITLARRIYYLGMDAGIVLAQILLLEGGCSKRSPRGATFRMRSFGSSTGFCLSISSPRLSLHI